MISGRSFGPGTHAVAALALVGRKAPAVAAATAAPAMWRRCLYVLRCRFTLSSSSVSLLHVCVPPHAPAPAVAPTCSMDVLRARRPRRGRAAHRMGRKRLIGVDPLRHLLGIGRRLV